MKKKKLFRLLALALVFALSLFGCSSGSSKNSVMGSGGYGGPASGASAPEYIYESSDSTMAMPDMSEAYAEENGKVTGGTALPPETDSGWAADAGRKMIWNGSLSLETTAHDTALSALNSLVTECGGFIQSSSTNGGVDAYGAPRLKYSYYTVRIPTDKFQFFMNAGSSVANVLYSSTNAFDISDQYFETETRLKVLKIKETQLLKMFEEGGDLQFLLQLESELSNTRFEIENLTGTLQRYDGLINYSTVTVELREVKTESATPTEPRTTGQEIAARFTASVEGLKSFVKAFFVLLVGYSPVIIIIVLFCAAVLLLVRRSRKRAAAKNSELQRHITDLTDTPEDGGDDKK